MSKQVLPELEAYRLRLYKWDKLIAAIIPLLVVSIISYRIAPNPNILWIGLGSSVLVFISIFTININNFKATKLFHFVSSYLVICLAAVIFPYVKYEYFLMPLLMLSVFSTYPFHNRNWNYSIGIICIVTSIGLFALEYTQQNTYPEYDIFNKIFGFALLYVATVEIVITALIGRKYQDLLYRDRLALKNQNLELAKYIESNLQLENFAHLASHDLKTPLSNVIRFSQLLKYKISNKLSLQEMELFDFVIDGSKHMSETINSLFQFSQATNKKMIYSKFKVGDLLKELKADIQVDLKEKNVNIRTENIDQYILADKVLVKQLFLNLILNSIKFINPGTQPEIVITCKDLGDFWKFGVKDNGIGIEPEYQDTIFLIFKRLHDKSTYEGTGAGLAICKKIVEQHGGEIWVESKPDLGSTFYFTIENAA